ncbi:unnamed protein product [Lampetra planeri]
MHNDLHVRFSDKSAQVDNGGLPTHDSGIERMRDVVVMWRQQQQRPLPLGSPSIRGPSDCRSLAWTEPRQRKLRGARDT